MTDKREIAKLKAVNIQSTKIESIPRCGQKIPARVLRVIDGDTYEALVMVGTTPVKYTIRLHGIDTPEKTRGRLDIEADAGAVCTAYLRDLLEDKIVQVCMICHDKYGGRVVANTYIDDMDVSEHLVHIGYAKQYNGRKKDPWKREELEHICQDAVKDGGF